MIVLHGLLGTSLNWRKFGSLPSISKDRRVILPDLRNHGSSPWNDDVSYDAMSDDVTNLLSSKNLPQCILVGHSLGGKVAMTTALRYPEMVSRLIVVDIAPRVNIMDDIRHILDSLLSIELSPGLSRRCADEILQETMPDSSKELRAFLLQNLLPGKSTKPSWKANIAVLRSQLDTIGDWPYSNQVYEGPCLIIRGSDSNYVKDGDKSLISAAFPNSEVVTIPNSGHWVHIEQPDLFSRTVSNFLSSYEA